jgi:hypothetical protein
MHSSGREKVASFVDYLGYCLNWFGSRYPSNYIEDQRIKKEKVKREKRKEKRENEDRYFENRKSKVVPNRGRHLCTVSTHHK